MHSNSARVPFFHRFTPDAIKRYEQHTRDICGKLVARFPTIEPTGIPVRGNRARFRGFSHYPVRLAQ